ncbi:MAG: cryptochrome/photolyase family protein [Acidimicrobiia bacterium]|nr:cryptochrome/photolyase family protein [Acidimicrobiia bacterium]
MDTLWILGDQLNRSFAGFDDVAPDSHRILMVRSDTKLSGTWHRQRLHLVLTAMRRFADELRDEGFEVDERAAPSLADGLAAHREEFEPDTVRVMEPASWDGLRLVEDLDCDVVRSNQFLCHYDDFADWAEDRKRLRHEDFYRWQRRRLGFLMDGDDPVGGEWNFDAENRDPPPDGDVPWPARKRFDLDDVDRSVLDGLPDDAWGADPEGWWPTSRDQALQRLEEFVGGVLPHFGPFQDAMLGDDWHLAHSLLSPALNIGLLTPDEVCDAVEEAYREGGVPIESAEGFIRQVIGWREYVWGLYWLWMPDYRDENAFGADGPLPAAFTGADTGMACLAATMENVRDRAYGHHIERLMVLGNLALLSGVEPKAMVDWMWRSFVDGAEWVMLPNVIGMALHADGGRMATKPYAASGAYIDRMSDHCGDCRYDPKQRSGEDACPFTALYWDFLARNREMLADNHRMGLQLKNLERIDDLDGARSRAAEVVDGLIEGTV